MRARSDEKAGLKSLILEVNRPVGAPTAIVILEPIRGLVDAERPAIS